MSEELSNVQIDTITVHDVFVGSDYTVELNHSKRERYFWDLSTLKRLAVLMDGLHNFDKPIKGVISQIIDQDFQGGYGFSFLWKGETYKFIGNYHDNKVKITKGGEYE